MCRSRLNFPDPAATYFIDVTASTAGGLQSATDIDMSPGSPVIGPLPLAGGNLFVEWTTPPAPIPAPSLDVRFDFLGQSVGVPSACSVQITENDPSSPVVLDASTTLVQNDTGPDDVAVVDPWPSVPQIASPDSTFSTSFAISQGTNRLLLVAIMPAFDNTPSQTAVSATYGGKPLTPITVSDLSQRRVAWLGYLNESDIATRVSNTLQGSVQGLNLAGTCVYVSSYAGVNQTTPISSSSNRYVNNVDVPVALLSALSHNAGGFGVFVFQVDNSANPPDSGGDGYVFSNGFQCGAGNYGRVSSMAMATAGLTNISVDYGIVRAAVAGATLNPVP